MIEFLVLNKTKKCLRVVCLCICYCCMDCSNSVHNTLVVINLGDTSFRPIIEPDRDQS